MSGLRALSWRVRVCVGWVAPRVPRVWCAGCRKSGEGTYRLVLSPLFLLFVWSGRRDLNPLPPPWEGGALPVELRPQACVPRPLALVLLLALGFGADNGT